MTTLHDPPAADVAPPRRARMTAWLAAAACAACCALPLLVTAGVLTSAGPAIAQPSLLAVSAVLLVAAGGLWFWDRRRRSRAPAASCGCGSPTCGC